MYLLNTSNTVVGDSTSVHITQQHSKIVDLQWIRIKLRIPQWLLIDMSPIVSINDVIIKTLLLQEAICNGFTLIS